jgi:hypothetical protein
MDFALYISRRGNIFMQELAGYLMQAIRAGGHTVTLVDHGVPGQKPGVTSIVVAPHEYCLLEPAFQCCDQSEVLARVVVVNTEQPGTSWFEHAVPFCARAGLVLDINEEGASELRRRGIEAAHFPLCYHPDIDLWMGRESLADRDLDVVFMGDLNRRRADLLAQYARILSHRRFRLFLSDSTVPIGSVGKHFVLGTTKAEVLRRTRVLLDLHRGPRSYFAWLRMLPALANGAVVVTEPADGLSPLRPFEHLVTASYDLLPYFIEALLSDEERRRQIARAAYVVTRTALSDRASWNRIAPSLLEFASRATRCLRAQAPEEEARVYMVEARGPQCIGDVAAGRSPIIDPDEVPDTAPVYPQGALMKQLFLGSRKLSRRIAELERILSGTAAVSVETTPAWTEGPGDVSVVVPIHNHEDYIDECLDSVLASIGLTPEVVLLDDASTDSTRERVRRYMERHPELPLAHVAFRVNRGLPAARNEGFCLARSEFVFLLDVDNLLYSKALVRLREELATSDAGFAYPIVEEFGVARGLMSRHPWDVPRLLISNYIDAMCLVRRSTWMAVGGYVDTAVEAEAVYGWEDYDFWLGCAERGIRGLLVPEILARYRRRHGSMISLTNLETESAITALRLRHPSLPWQPA